MTAQERPFAGLNGIKDRCAEPKCLRKCLRHSKPDHAHGVGYGECHDGPCWPKAEQDRRKDAGL